MKLQTKDLSGAALDWAVAKCEYGEWDDEQIYANITDIGDGEGCFSPSTDWAQGGPIIEREGITLVRIDDTYGRDERGFCNNVRIPVWAATTGEHGEQSQYEGECYEPQYEVSVDGSHKGPTPLIAAMRCFCASKLGSEIGVPAELCE